MTFKEINCQIEQLLEELKQSPAYSEATLSNLTIDSGAYVFYKGNKAMYVGIVGPHSKQKIQTRVFQWETYDGTLGVPDDDRRTGVRFRHQKATCNRISPPI